MTLRVELDALAQVNLPCIIHMDLNHFVVLDKVGRHFQTMEPAVLLTIGQRFNLRGLET